MTARLSDEAARFLAIVQRIRRSDEISVPDAARLLKKDSEWVRANFPVIVHSRHSHHVRLADVEAYQDRRTIWPAWLRKNGAT